jgi:hypothetical protein
MSDPVVHQSVEDLRPTIAPASPTSAARITRSTSADVCRRQASSLTSPVSVYVVLCRSWVITVQRHLDLVYMRSRLTWSGLRSGPKQAMPEILVPEVTTLAGYDLSGLSGEP